MFTGIIEELGKVQSVQKGKNTCSVTIYAPNICKDIQIGDSIAVNGTCLTVIEQHSNNFKADIMPETLRKTNLGVLKKGEMVNLEKALKLSDQLGGHMVSGHIDEVGKIVSKKREKNAVILEIETKSHVIEGLILKGSVAVDGVSLTVMTVSENSFAVSIIPHTAKTTTLGLKKQGKMVNIETDLVAKHIKKFLSVPKKSLTTEKLERFGYFEKGG